LHLHGRRRPDRNRSGRESVDGVRPGGLLLAHGRRALPVTHGSGIRDEGGTGALRLASHGDLVRLDVPRQPGGRARRGAGRGDRAGRDRAAVAPGRPGRFLHAVRGVGVRRRRRDGLPRAMDAPPGGRRRVTLGDLIRQRASDPADADRVYLRFEDATWTFAATYREACRYANLFAARLDPAAPKHIGLLLENRPEFVFAELGAALAGAVIVGLNPTRRGEHLARDVAYSDCQIVITEPKFAGLLADVPAPPVLTAEDSLTAALSTQPES